jgi:vacuolar-type H+-ATPase subunit H
MATVPLQSQVDELEKVLSQYRLGIAQALEKDLEKEKARLKELAENQAGQIIAGAQRESALITARAQQQADQTLAQARDQANGKVALLLAEAQQKADQILAAAEDRAKREARDRAQKELDRITKESKEEALKLVAAARQVSEETAGSIITEARKEADRLTRKYVDDARREVEASAKTTLELKVKAERDIEEIRRRAQMEADQITNEARENVRKSDKKEVVGIIAEAKQKA